MALIDIHTHIYPDNIACKAANSIREFYEMDHDVLDGTVKTLLERGDRAGIDRFVVLPVAVRAEHVRHINNFIIETVKKQPRFVGFGTLHADCESPAAEAEYIINEKLHGVKIHPDTQGFAIDDERLFEFYDFLGDKIPVLFHMGDPRYDYSHPARLRRVMKMFPKLKVIAAHFGGYSMPETAAEYLKDTNCIFDVSSSIMFMHEGEAERYINLYGAERTAFGTDYPLWDPAVEIERFKKLKLTSEQFEQISHKTAEQFLGL